MPIKKNLSDIPRTVKRTAGHPDENLRFMDSLARAWWQQYQDEGKTSRAMSADTPFRGSDAGSCSYSLGLTLLERAGLGERSNPPGMADSWRMGIGSMVHDKLEEVLPLAFPGATCEVVGVTGDDLVSFHADVLVEIPERTEERESDDGTAIAVIPAKRVLIEVKTINGFGFKRSTMPFKGEAPEGPRANAVMQGALAAETFDCDELVIGYLSLELVSVREAQRNQLSEVQRFAAEWTYTKEEYLPFAEAERARFAWIKGTVDAGRMPERSIPGLPTGAVIVDPVTGSWTVTDELTGVVTDVGSTWHCDYCWHRDACRALASEGH